MKKALIAGVGIALVAAVAFMAYRVNGGPQPSAGETASVSAAAPFDLSFCSDTMAVSAGTLCAIKPSATDSRIKDVYNAAGKPADQNLGFGYHVVAVPDDWQHAKGLWVHFTGSYGRPYDQRRDTYDSSVWLDELTAEGYVVIQVAYDNRFSINGELCGTRNLGHDRDNCAGEVREVALSGNATSPYRSTDAYNTIDYRLQSLLTYLKDKKVVLPGNIDPNRLDWSNVRISGHSQGGNQAYYVARKRPVAFVCILAAGYDTPDTVNPGSLAIADWFTAGTSATPLSRTAAVIAEADDSYQVFSLGLTKAVGLSFENGSIVKVTQRTFVDKNGETVNGHAGTHKDPSLKDARARACFR